MLDTCLQAARTAYEKKAEELVLLDVQGLVPYCDYFLIANGTNRRQVRAIAEAIRDELELSGLRPQGIEGLDSGRWVLVDYGDFVVHIFNQETRAFYDLDGLWADAPRVPVEPPPARAPVELDGAGVGSGPP